MKTIAYVDTSWLMYMNYHALSSLSVTRQTSLGQVTCPTGHVYGFYQDIKNLASHYSLVVLCVDSVRHQRREIMSSYKAGRHEDGGYNIYNDLINILTLCTSFPNVYYVKVPEYETDDLMASFIRDTKTQTNRRCTFYHNDNDILQTPGDYDWCPKIAAGPKNRVEYISSKYLNEKFPIQYDYLPIWVKVVTGDSSDRIPSSIPRFPKDKLKEIVDKIPDSQDLNKFIDTLIRVCYKSSWADRVASVKDPESDLYKAIKRNYDVVCPAYLDTSTITYKKLPSDAGKIQEIFDYYQIVNI